MIGLARLIRVEKVNNAEGHVFKNHDVFFFWILEE
jgi:hypothetical protein